MISENVVTEVITEGEFQCYSSFWDRFTFHLECIASADLSAFNCRLKVTALLQPYKKTKLRVLNPRANYTDRAAAACRRS
jgi:hypothetical protein